MSKSIRQAYGETLVEIAKSNNKIVVFDADLSGATQTAMFKKEFPDRFYNLGIAEADLMATAAAFAREGLVPFASTFAVFGAGRAFEIIRNSIAYTNLNVKIALTHSGISVGEDGGSHQSIEDIALMRVLPNMKVVVPCDPLEARKATIAVSKENGPCYLRLSRPSQENVTNDNTEFVIGKANVLKEGKDVSLVACGLMVEVAMKASELLKQDNIDCEVINMHTIKPIDKEVINKINKEKKLIVTIEEHSVIGGLGSAVAEIIAGSNGAKFKMIGIEDKFGQSGTQKELFEYYGLTAENVANVVRKELI